ncbi:tetratricopeptide repeat protein [Coraliomargarita algicola]|uniref:Tetratricopeptide repeat protein n=1 Tax=Coraliomargarita algicola TaxID=3092156 RepID=A0ABZ0RHC2_9BACT|nr:tetratricopeptide repeat protein [Coraliomargarita sp. J2-16]WPJ94596.1 tetratricopeptide repeat protein [Coraliomargarita sp. J2-16]
MKITRLLTILASMAAPFSSGLLAQDYPLSENLWTNPEFQNRFLGSYGFDTSITPKITADEQEIFKQLVPLMQNNANAAIQQLRSAITNESSAALDYTLGNLYAQENQVSNAIRSYQTAIRKFPNFYRAYKNLALVMVNEGRYEEAVPFLLKGLELGGTDGALYGPLGLAYLNLEKPKSALTAYDNALLFAPDSLQWQQGKLRCLMDLNLYKESAGMLEEMILEDSQNQNYWKWQANAFLSEDDMAKASANLEILKRLGNADGASLGLLGDIYLNEGMTDMALENYLLAADQESLSSARLIRPAHSFASRRLWNEASTYLDKTKSRLDSLSPKEQSTFLTLQAQAAMGLGETEQASTILEALVAEDPMNGQALLTLGNLQRELDRIEDAAFSYEQAAQVEETRVDALVQHARMLISLRDYSPAVTLLQRVVLLEPGPRYEDFLERVQSANRASKGQI